MKLERTYYHLLVVIIISLLSLHMIECSESAHPKQLDCLLNTEGAKVSAECIQKLDVDSLIKENSKYMQYMCPLILKIYQQNTDLRDLILEKAQQICAYSADIDPENGYLMIGLYLLKRNYLKALFLEYEMFYNSPFDHESNFKKVMKNFEKYLESDQTIAAEENYLTKFNRTIKIFYLNKSRESSILLSEIKQLEGQTGLLAELYSFLKLRALQKNGQFSQALQYVNKVLDNSKDKKSHWYFYHIKGNLLMHHLKFREAIQYFQQSVAARNQLKQPYFLFSFYNIGLCYQKLGEIQNSMKYFRTVIEKKQNADSLNALGFNYYSLMDLKSNNKQVISKNKKYAQKAQKLFERAIKINPNYFIAYYNYGMMQYDLKNYAKSTQLLETALKLNPQQSNLSSRYGLFKALYMSNKPKAIDFLRKQLLTNSEVQYSDIGFLFYQLGQYKMAHIYLEDAVTTKRGNMAEIYQWKGLVQFQMDKKQEAGASFRKALQLGNNKAEIWFNLGYLQQLKEDYKKAEQYYKKSLQKNPNGPGKERLQQIKGKLTAKTEQL